MTRRIALVIIIILGIIIIFFSGNRTISDPPTEKINYIEVDTVGEYIPQTIEREEYVPQSQRLMV